MGTQRAAQLIRKYLEGTATLEEEALLETWYISAAQDQPKIKSPLRLWTRIAAAAAVLIMVSVGSLIIIRKNKIQPVVEIYPLGNEILPARTRATLTLLDGSTMALDSATNRVLARQGDANISSLDGQLIYPANGPDQLATSGAISYNTLTTRPGQHYSLLLPDGSRVWLNSASSITYPIVFPEDERKVKVTGEAYFEIAHNPNRPFKISVKNQLVEVMGTHLNINAYESESINTTLLEGSIRITKGSVATILTPGQQAISRPNDSSFQIKQIDADEAIAWKNGYFYFDRADIRTVMRELARWYNVQIIYKGTLPKRTFKGKVYRNINASEALSVLSFFGARFSIEGKTITVSS